MCTTAVACRENTLNHLFDNFHCGCELTSGRSCHDISSVESMKCLIDEIYPFVVLNIKLFVQD